MLCDGDLHVDVFLENSEAKGRISLLHPFSSQKPGLLEALVFELECVLESPGVLLKQIAGPTPMGEFAFLTSSQLM